MRKIKMKAPNRSIEKSWQMTRCIGGPWDGQHFFSRMPGDTHVFTCKGQTGHYNTLGHWCPFKEA